MKHILALLLYALFAAYQAGARTLYVDASRPNNKGNGLKAKTAKKTIQAAINIAKKGDTIVVLPGEYSAPLTTNNKKISIKSRNGKNKTTVACKKDKSLALDFGGNSSKFTGFTVIQATRQIAALRGGTIQNCVFRDFGGHYFNKGTFCNAKLTACALESCYADSSGRYFIRSCTLQRCKLVDCCNPIISSKLYNCLIQDNYELSLKSCILANCTVADNTSFSMKSTKAYNTVFSDVAASQFKKSKKNTLKCCYTGSNPKFAGKNPIEVPKNGDYDFYEWDDALNDYRYYVFELDCHLAKGSPCIDKGTKATAVKKLFGSKDLDGKKRIKGKSVDIGCYEY